MVVPRGQVDDAVVELVPFSGDQLVPEGAAGGGCGGQAMRQAPNASQQGPACGLDTGSGEAPKLWAEGLLAQGPALSSYSLPRVPPSVSDLLPTCPL